MAQVNFRIDENLKKNAEQVLNEMGLTMSAAITMFLVKVSRERSIPFKITADPFYSDENVKAIENHDSNISNTNVS